MRLHDDDEVYEVDGSYLGPPGRFIGVMRYKVIFLWLVLGPMVLWVVRMLQLELTLLTGGLLVIGLAGVIGALADRITPERSMSDLVGTFWAEVRAARVPMSVDKARGADLGVVARPPARLTRRRGRTRDESGPAVGLVGAVSHRPPSRRRRLDGSR